MFENLCWKLILEISQRKLPDKCSWMCLLESSLRTIPWFSSLGDLVWESLSENPIGQLSWKSLFGLPLEKGSCHFYFWHLSWKYRCDFSLRPLDKHNWKTRLELTLVRMFLGNIIAQTQSIPKHESFHRVRRDRARRRNIMMSEMTWQTLRRGYQLALFSTIRHTHHPAAKLPRPQISSDA